MKQAKRQLAGSGEALPVGVIGEVITGSVGVDTTFTSTSYVDIANVNITLPAGTWAIYFSTTSLLRFSALSNGTRMRHLFLLAKADNTSLKEEQGAVVEVGQTPLNNLQNVKLQAVVRLTQQETLKIRAKVANWGGTEVYTIAESIQYTGGGALASFYAVRIA